MLGAGRPPGAAGAGAALPSALGCPKRGWAFFNIIVNRSLDNHIWGLSCPKRGALVVMIGFRRFLYNKCKYAPK